MKEFFTVEDVKQMKVANDNLILALRKALAEVGNEDVEGLVFKHDNVCYTLVDIGRDDEIDEGKYINGCAYYQIESFDDSEITYPCTKNELDKFNIGVEQGYSKSGSYYSGYEWYYDTPSIAIISTKIVPEVVIPRHEEVAILYK